MLLELPSGAFIDPSIIKFAKVYRIKNHQGEEVERIGVGTVPTTGDDWDYVFDGQDKDMIRTWLLENSINKVLAE